VNPDVHQQGLRCNVEPDRERVIVRPVGEIDLASVGVVEGPLTDLLASGFAALVLDLRGVTFMDSTGLRLLMRTARRAEADGVDLAIEIDPAGPVHRLLELTAVLPLLPIRTAVS
jgi:anti-anti-sigma factor